MRHHLNLYPAAVEDTPDRLTVHREPEKLKGRIVGIHDLQETQFSLVHTCLG